MSSFVLSGRRRWLLTGLAAAAGLTAGGAALAAEARAYAVISLIADEMRVVGEGATTGTAISRNAVQAYPLSFDVIEAHALNSATQALLAADAVGTVAPVKLTEAKTYADQSGYVDGERATLPPKLVSMLRGADVSHLLLLTKHRGEARMQALNTTHGTGRVEGVGYYLDRDSAWWRPGTGERTLGFIAPYVYVRLSLIDMKTLNVVRTETVMTGQVMTAIGTSAGRDPWEVLTPQAKIDTLKTMIDTEVRAAVPRLMGKP